MAHISEDREIFDFENDDDDDLPSVKQILASSKRPKWAVDLTGDDDDDRDGDDSDFTKVSWLGTTRTARHLVRLIPPSIDRIMRNIVDNSNPQNLKIEPSLLLIFESMNLR
jgi:hypothetical protein